MKNPKARPSTFIIAFNFNCQTGRNLKLSTYLNPWRSTDTKLFPPKWPNRPRYRDGVRNWLEHRNPPFRYSTSIQQKFAYYNRTTCMLWVQIRSCRYCYYCFLLLYNLVGMSLVLIVGILFITVLRACAIIFRFKKIRHRSPGMYHALQQTLICERFRFSKEGEAEMALSPTFSYAPLVHQRRSKASCTQWLSAQAKAQGKHLR